MLVLVPVRVRVVRVMAVVVRGVMRVARADPLHVMVVALLGEAHLHGVVVAGNQATLGSGIFVREIGLLAVSDSLVVSNPDGYGIEARGVDSIVRVDHSDVGGRRARR